MKGLPVRALGFVLMGAIVSLPLNFLNYKRYWQGTIYSVQTVDFNILSHSFPTKLSELLIQGNTSEIHRTVNSNYGLFSIVVTNCTAVTVSCPNEKILYASKSYYGAADVTIADLNHQPFNILRNPAPLYPEWSFDNPHAVVPIPLTVQNLGQPIGRVYYLRSTPPSFFADLIRKFREVNSPEDILDIYIITVGLSITSFLLIWVGIEKALRHYTNQKLLEAKNTNLALQLSREEIQRKDLEHRVLILEAALTQEQENKLNLELSMQSLREQIREEQDQIHQSEEQINQLQREVNSLRMQKEHQLECVQGLQNIQTADLANQQNSLAELQQILEGKERELEQARNIVQRYKKSLVALQSKHNDLQDNVAQANINIEQKQQELNRLQVQFEEQTAIIQAELNTVKASEQVARSENEELHQYLENLQREIDRLQRGRNELGQLANDRPELLKSFESIMEYQTFFEWIDSEPRTSQLVAKWIENHDSALKAFIEDSDDGYTYLNILGSLLYNAIKKIQSKEQDFLDLKERNSELFNKVKNLERKNYRLESTANTSGKNSNSKDLITERDLIHFQLTEIDFYPDERRDLILDILKSSLNNVHHNSRRYHILQNLITHNLPSSSRESLRNQIESLFNDYREMKVPMKNSLEDIGFEIISESNHYKIRFFEDNRYVITFAKTASDNRAGKNIIRDICNKIL